MSSLFQQLIDQMDAGVLLFDTRYRIHSANPAMRVHAKDGEPVGRNLFDAYPCVAKKWLVSRVEHVLSSGGVFRSDWQENPHPFPFSDRDSGQSQVFQDMQLHAVEDAGEVLLCLMLSDKTDTALSHKRLEDATTRLEAAQNQVLQAEKLASIGNLVAGVAHEINNPVCFIKANVTSLQDYLEAMNGVIDGYSDLIEHHATDGVRAERDTLYQESDMAFIRGELSDMMRETLDGTERIEGIVGSLKDFARVGDNAWVYADLHRCLEGTLKVVNNEIKYVVREVVRNYGEIPQVYCRPAQLSQVFMNLILNAAQAIDRQGIITISTEYLTDSDQVCISVSDDGCGIEEEQLAHIFEPFFTTKSAKKGTGLGLSVSHAIVEAHGGKIDVTSTPGEGATFVLQIPVHPQRADAQLSDGS